MSKCRGYADIEKNIFKKDLKMEESTRIYDKEVRKEKEIKALLDKCESWGALRVLYRHFNASKSANLKPE